VSLPTPEVARGFDLDALIGVPDGVIREAPGGDQVRVPVVVAVLYQVRLFKEELTNRGP